MAKPNTATVILELPVGSALFKNGERYEIIEKSIKLKFPVGTALRTSPTSLEELLLSGDQLSALQLTPARGKYSYGTKAGMTFRVNRLNADITFKDEQLFDITQETMVNVQKGTYLSLNGMRVIKDDDTPMYLSCKVETADLFNAFFKERCKIY